MRNSIESLLRESYSLMKRQRGLRTVKCFSFLCMLTDTGDIRSYYYWRVGASCWNRQILFINPRRACAARVTVLGLCVCVSVCVCVSINSRTTGTKPAHERY